jgi:N-acetylmuramoyl-L-alanine amidase
MSPRRLPLILALLLALAAVALWWRRPEPPQAVAPPAPSPAGLSDLGSPPDWSSLERFQGAVTRADFIRRMDEVFTVSPAWRDWFQVGEREVAIRTGPEPEPGFRLRFAEEGDRTTPPRFWRTLGELPPAPRERPLDGLRIAIDPGHIGGRWGKMEERWFQLPGSRPVQEGDMTLLVATLLKPRLEALGARVDLVRDQSEPVTESRPESLREEAAGTAAGGDIAKLAERLFYRTAEIRARARRVNEALRPDLVLCLHFNADAWGDPNAPTLAPGHHFHMILNGGYTDAELALADQRHDLLLKLLQGVHDEEKALSASIAEVFVERTAMPPYLYDPAAKNARNVDGNPYLWARNLLANRLYQCPVAYFEPYVMNSREDHERIQAGDYEGLREVAGKARPSIFREYADAAASGLERHYRQRRVAP